MAYRNPNMIMPSMDDMIMWLLGVSEVNYDGEWIVGWAQYETSRPTNWPTAFAFLKHYKFIPHGSGWLAFVDKHIGIPVATPTVRNQWTAAQRVEKRCEIHSKPDYTGAYNAEYAALPSGMAVCMETYQKTGRMILR